MLGMKRSCRLFRKAAMVDTSWLILFKGQLFVCIDQFHHLCYICSMDKRCQPIESSLLSIIAVI